VRRLVRNHDLKVVAVAGSVGKTGTRMAVATVLEQKYRIQKMAQLGYNSEIGLPLSVFEMNTPGLLTNPFAWIWRLIRTEQLIRGSYPADMLVLELGTDRPGEIARYLRYLAPDLGILTAVTPEHMANFPGGLAQVAAEELLLATGCKQFLSSSDDIPAFYRHKYIDNHPDHHNFGISRDTEYRVEIDHSDLLKGVTCRASKKGRVTIKHVEVKLYGGQGAKTVAAAYAAGDLLGLTTRQITKGLESISAVPGRMNVLAGINGSIIIDDSYNASPHAVKAALEALTDATVSGRRIALLGSMNELGSDGPKYHAEAGVLAAGIDLLITLGDLANRYLGPSAVQAGLDPTSVHAADTPQAAGEYLKLMLRPGDVLLAKGSQNGVFTEEAVKILLADPADEARLVRQSAGWLKTKASQFPDATAIASS
ncbi:MAG TPA: Mur ligase family protein, partial [Candidatus Saccharimonadia bacterium]|nr:Mur ligase family protein [Candidatus Saccharimonadia bacterium]